MSIIVSGPGLGLQPPQNLYPAQLFNAPLGMSSNLVTLNAGDALTLTAGRNLISLGSYCTLEYQDYTTGIWRVSSWGAWERGYQIVESDGFTRRIANRLGCPIGAIVTGGGSGFVAATAAIAASQGGSTWQAIVGGSLLVQSITNAGAGYTQAPIVFVPAPPNPGIQATAYATISAGTVASVSFVNFGAGYTTAPTLSLLSNPTDPGPITTPATATCSIVVANAAKITGALCTNFGTPVTTLSTFSLTASGGAGSGATIIPVVLQTVTSSTIPAAGLGFGSASAPLAITSVGGMPTTTSAIGNPAAEMSGFIPRPFLGYVAVGATGSITATAATVIDGGLFAFAPSAAFLPGAGGLGASSTAVSPSIVFTMGSTYDTVTIQPL